MSLASEKAPPRVVRRMIRAAFLEGQLYKEVLALRERQARKSGCGHCQPQSLLLRVTLVSSGL